MGTMLIRITFHIMLLTGPGYGSGRLRCPARPSKPLTNKSPSSFRGTDFRGMSPLSFYSCLLRAAKCALAIHKPQFSRPDSVILPRDSVPQHLPVLAVCLTSRGFAPGLPPTPSPFLGLVLLIFLLFPLLGGSLEGRAPEER